MGDPRVRRPRTALGALAAALVVAVSALAGCASGDRDEDGSGRPAAVRLPPKGAGFDYQIGGAYPPPKGVRVVSRDRSDSPAPGLYNICYVNAFQAQPAERSSWPADLLLRDGRGRLVIDEDWDEPLLDIRTPAKRERIAKRVNGWIDGCADKGFDAVEPDNYDSYTRSDGLLSTADATAFMALLSRHAHARHLAIAQKNTAELAARRERAGLDFAVTEECGQYDECGVYAKAFDDRVVDIEYTDRGLDAARARWGDRLSIVRRDRDVSTPGSAAYVRAVR
ncbi:MULTISPECIES: endo alpha-1,4 polygalactosaminidase [Streptomyces]|uniref:Endo alpha-1,4 polygalactosaminidase n=1 Tax=Streptomyces eurythermus TaxID=42237 RepID=A0ABW6YPL5_9ACTN|nr:MULTISPECIES: endo alpha-1,4 polygalactosaminidase [Streptomyces]QIS74652.1 endo alpha-1,4 polygalactosaminidase [Streptomyces sp. DSM 40868]WDM10682.1 endo alpha-1,4 polygalactosaminidase [Streptomyces lavenduligriseus]